MKHTCKRLLLIALALLAALALTACATTAGQYEKAQKLMARGEYAEAAGVFAELGSYEDSSNLTMYCRACAAAETGDYLTAITTLESMGDYKDCPRRVTYYTARAHEDKAGTDNWELMLEAQEIYRTIPLFQDSQTRISALDERIANAKASQYNAAVKAGEAGDYLAAEAGFRRLGSYQDSRQRITYYGIREDEDALKGSDAQDEFLAVANRYSGMGQYLDCAARATAMTARADQIVADRYQQVDGYIAGGHYENADFLLRYFGNYGSEQIPAKYYAMGEHARQAGKWSAAADAYTQAGRYSDSPNRLTYVNIRADEDALKGSTDQDALVAVAKRYTKLGKCLDSADRAAALTSRADQIVADRYAQVDAYIAAGEYDKATTVLHRFGSYGSGQVSAKYYQMGEHARQADKWSAAADAYTRAGRYSDAPDRLTYVNIRKDEDALKGSTDQDAIIAVAKRYTKLGKCLDSADRSAALTARADQIVADRYAQVDAYIAEGEYDKPTSLMKNFGTYGSEQIPAKYYAMGEHALAAGKYANADKAFRNAGSYADAPTRIIYTAIRADEAALEGTTDQDALLAVAKRYTDMGDYLDCPDRAAALTARADQVVADKYQQVDAYIAEGEYDKATNLMIHFGAYGYDSNRLPYISIRKNEAALEGTTDQDALVAVAKRYTDLGNYLDCADRAAALTARADQVVADKYQQVDAYIAAGEYDKATNLMKYFGSYGYDKNRLTYVNIRKDEDALKGTTNQDALVAVAKRYTRLGNCLDSSDRAAALTSRADQIVADRYQQVDAYIAEGEYDKATSLMKNFGTYGSEQIPGKYYAMGEHAAASGNYDIAFFSYSAAGSYSDAAAKTAALMPMFSNRISAGDYHTVGLRADGTVVAVGNNGYGQCDVSGWSDIVAISAGDFHTVGLRADGTVVAVGNNGYGKCNVSGWKDIVAISAGFNHTVGLRADGTVVAVGDNGDGQCKVSGWSNIVAISAGVRHTVGLRADGTVVAVGNKIYYRWSDIVAISAGDFHTVGLRADGTVVAVGSNLYSQCRVSGWSDIVAISAGDEHTIGLRADGTVVAVGYTKYGRCNVSGWSDIVAISAGGYHTVGLRADGTVVAVGDNEYGQCDVSDWNLFD